MLLSHLRGVVAAAGIALLTLPAVSAADVLLADLDGDGRPDQITFSAGAPDVLVRLSHGGLAAVRLHTRARVVRIVAVDVDHDGDLDLVASTASSGLRFWINNGSGRFSARRPIRHGDRWSASGPRLDMSQRDDGGAEIQQVTQDLVVEETGALPHEPRADSVWFLRLGTFVLRPVIPTGALRGPPVASLT